MKLVIVHFFLSNVNLLKQTSICQLSLIDSFTNYMKSIFHLLCGHFNLLWTWRPVFCLVSSFLSVYPSFWVISSNFQRFFNLNKSTMAALYKKLPNWGKAESVKKTSVFQDVDRAFATSRLISAFTDPKYFRAGRNRFFRAKNPPPPLPISIIIMMMRMMMMMTHEIPGYVCETHPIRHFSFMLFILIFIIAHIWDEWRWSRDCLCEEGAGCFLPFRLGGRMCKNRLAALRGWEHPLTDPSLSAKFRRDTSRWRWRYNWPSRLSGTVHVHVHVRDWGMTVMYWLRSSRDLRKRAEHPHFSGWTPVSMCVSFHIFSLFFTF